MLPSACLYLQTTDTQTFKSTGHYPVSPSASIDYSFSQNVLLLTRVKKATGHLVRCMLCLPCKTDQMEMMCGT